MPLRIVATKPNPALVTLPWSTPLEEWDDTYVVPLPRGLSRHVVRIVRLGHDVYAVKETREAMAFREYRMLRDLRRMDLPTVEPVAVVDGREAPDGEEIEPALVTRHLTYSLPYRWLFSHGLRADSLPKLIDALAVLLVRLHLAGFFWGDVSLSNVLFRRSAGEFTAYLVDAETGELHPQLSEGQRNYDLEVAYGNLFGELLDLQAGGFLDEAVDPHEIIELVETRYTALWQRADRDRGVRHQRDVAHRAADRAAQRPRLRRRRARHRHRLGRRDGAAPAEGRGGRPPLPRAAGPDRPRRGGQPGAAAAQRRGRVHARTPSWAARTAPSSRTGG